MSNLGSVTFLGGATLFVRHLINLTFQVSLVILRPESSDVVHLFLDVQLKLKKIWHRNMWIDLKRMYAWFCYYKYRLLTHVQEIKVWETFNSLY